MRLLHLVDRLDSRRPAARAAIEGLASTHPSLVLAGVVAPEIALPCEVVRLAELASVTARPLTPSLDEAARRFAPDALLLHSGVNAEALAFVARRRGAIVVEDLRAFHPERAATVRLPSAATEASARPLLCAECFDDSLFFRAIRDAARARVTSLEGAGVVLVRSSKDAHELAAVGASAPVAVVADLSDGAALLTHLERAHGLT
jgi:hypothetical protein